MRRRGVVGRQVRRRQERPPPRTRCGRPDRAESQFMRQAQPAPPAPHPPLEGWGEDGVRGAAVPTMPGLESCLDSSDPWHAGHAGVRVAVTKASNCRPQSRHAYSKRGIADPRRARRSV
jgi:hypothetical protein